MTTAEVDALPWWELRMLIDGLNKEFAPPEDDEDSFSTEINPQDRVFDAASFGLNVHSV